MDEDTTAPDARGIGIVFSSSADGRGRSMPVRDQNGRVRICENDGKRVGWATLADIEWTDTLP